MAMEDSAVADINTEVETPSGEESDRSFQVPHVRRNIEVTMPDGTIAVRVRKCVSSLLLLNITNCF